MTKEAFENAITVVIALGGSTNAVLHILAMANASNVDITLDDFTRIGKRVPMLADLKPSGHYQMAELIEIGGIQPLMKMLLNSGLLHGDCLTVTGKTLAENLADVQPYPVGQDIIRDFEHPIKKDSHLVILYGNLASEGSVAKITGKEGLLFTGNAKVFDAEEQALQAILNGEIVKGDVIVIRYEGPKGGPECAKCCRQRLRLWAKVWAKKSRQLLTDDFQAAHGFVVGHITPEAFVGGVLAVVKNGDSITIDAETNALTLHVDENEITRRFEKWQQPAPRYTRGVLAKYAKLVNSASLGAVTDN